MSKEAQHAMTRARTQLLFNHGFFGALALRLKIVPEPSIKTLDVNGKVLRYNPDYVLSLSEELRQTAIAHEVMHCVLDHIGRAKGRTPKRWNSAADFATNEILDKAGMELHPSWLRDATFDGKSADEIYNILPPDDDSESQDEIQPGESSADMQADAHDWQIAAGQAAQAAAARGKLPGALERFITEMNQPKVDWRAALWRFANQVSNGDYSWMRPQRRFLSMGLVLPGLYSEAVGTMVAVSDDSGSVSGDILNALASEIEGIAQALTPERLIHISCDSRINHVGEFGRGDPFKMVSKGGGGTDFRPPFHYLEEQDITPACMVYLTDGYGPFPDAPPPYPVLWCMTTDVIPPWGEHVRIEL